MGLQTAGRIDDCSYWITRVSFISVSLAVMLIYPRMMAVHTLFSEVSDFLDSLIILFFSSPNRIYNFHADMAGSRWISYNPYNSTY